MLIFSKLGKKGNLGNQLFQIASVAGIALCNNHSYAFPCWEYEKYFKNKLPRIPPGQKFQVCKEKCYQHHHWNLEPNKDYDLEGWLQSEKYFDISLTKKLFKFNEEFEKKLLEKNEKIFENNPILISVRRGDFVHHPMYFQLSFKYYFLALIRNFPDWKERNLIFTSDDPAYCKYHFGNLPNSFFLENEGPVEQLLFGSKCKDFIISNSTFSWWIAWLGEKKNSKVICPIKNFSETIKLDDSDYYPERWAKFDHRNKRIPLKYSLLLIKGYTYQFKRFLANKKNGIKYRIQTLIHR